MIRYKLLLTAAIKNTRKKNIMINACLRVSNLNKKSTYLMK